MTSTFLTIINFSMLGLLRRLHRLQIQANLQAQSDETGIVYPQVQKHKCKDGRNLYESHSLQEISDAKIQEAITRAKINAKASIEKLGMADLLHKHKQWDTVPTVASDTDIHDSDEDKDEDDDQTDQDRESVINSVVQEVCSEDPSAVEADIAKLSDSLITFELKDRLYKLQQSLPKLNRIPGTSISMFTSSSLDDLSKEIPQKTKKPTILPFVEVSIGSNDRPLFIRKTTAVWLFQEGERVSSDRLFRVRAK